MGNSVYIPEVDAGSRVSTGSKGALDAIALATDGNLLTATTLGEVLDAAGMTLVALSSSTQGSGMLLNHTVAGGAVIHPDYTLPDDLGTRIAEALGRRLPPDAPVADRTRWIVDVYLHYVVTELRPDVAILWLGDLDGASHASGVGSPAARSALAAVDAEIARIDGALDDVNILVASDHGFSTHTGEMDLDALLAPFTGTLTDGSPDVVRAGGAIYLRDGDQDKLTAIRPRTPAHCGLRRDLHTAGGAGQSRGNPARDAVPGAGPLGPSARGRHSGVGGPGPGTPTSTGSRARQARAAWPVTGQSVRSTSTPR